MRPENDSVTILKSSKSVISPSWDKGGKELYSLFRVCHFLANANQGPCLIMSIIEEGAQDDPVKTLDAEQPVPGADAQRPRIDLHRLVIDGPGARQLVPFGQAAALGRVFVRTDRAGPRLKRARGRHERTRTGKSGRTMQGARYVRKRLRIKKHCR